MEAGVTVYKATDDDDDDNEDGEDEEIAGDGWRLETERKVKGHTCHNKESANQIAGNSNQRPDNSSLMASTTAKAKSKVPPLSYPGDASIQGLRYYV